MPAPSPRTARMVSASLIAAATARFAWQHYGCVYDDAFIYFRYAQIARQGCLYCFNAGGPRVEGVTSPVQFFALLAATGAGASPVLAATVLGAVCLALALVVAAWTPLRLVASRPAALAACAAITALSFDHYLQLNAVTGLETAPAVLFVALIARSASLAAHPLLGTLVVVGSLVRPEITLFALLLPLLPAMRAWRRLAPVGLGLAAIAAARFAVFGDVVPNTYRAKSGGGVEHLVLGARYLAEVVRDEPLVLLAPAALFIPGQLAAVRYVLAAAALWCAFFLRSGGDHFNYGRLAAPIVPTLIAWGACGLLARLAQTRRPTALPIAATVGMVTVTLAVMRAHDLPPQHSFDNVLRWVRLGRALRTRYPGKTLATVPIGAIAYVSRARVIDLVGLTEPAIGRYGESIPRQFVRRTWIGHERYNTAWVLAQRPDVIVTNRWRDRPWRTLAEAQAGFYADRLILAEMRAGRAQYAVGDVEVSPGMHWLVFERVP